MPLLEPGQSYLHTYSGKKFYPLTPTFEGIDILDIAHGLALTNRFGGQTKDPYSVAHHSVLVSRYCGDTREAFNGLLHDASEAFLGDVPSPIKYSDGFLAYREAEDALMTMIAYKYGFDWPKTEAVDRADELMLHAEAHDLFPTRVGWAGERPADIDRIKPWSAKKAEREFLARFFELTPERIFYVA